MSKQGKQSVCDMIRKITGLQLPDTQLLSHPDTVRALISEMLEALNVYMGDMQLPFQVEDDSYRESMREVLFMKYAQKYCSQLIEDFDYARDVAVLPPPARVKVIGARIAHTMSVIGKQNQRWSAKLADYNVLTDQMEKVQEQVEYWNAEYTAAEQKRAYYDNILAEENLKAEALQTQMDAASEEYKEVDERHQVVLEHIGTVDDQIMVKREEMQKARERCEMLRELLNEPPEKLRADVEKLREELANVRGEAERLDAEVQRSRAKIQALEKIGKNIAKCDRLLDELAEARAKVKAQRGDKKAIEVQIEQLRQMISEDEAYLKTTRETRIQAAKKNELETNRQREAALKKYRGELEKVEKANRVVEGEVHELRRQIEDVKQGLERARQAIEAETEDFQRTVSEAQDCVDMLTQRVCVFRDELAVALEETGRVFE